MRVSGILCLFLVISAVWFSQWCQISYGDESLLTGREFLVDKFHEIEKELKKSPFYLESYESKNACHGDIYSTINYPFSTIKKVLMVPTNWCEIVLPHPYIRACTYKKMHDACLLDIYNVNKFSKPLEDSYQMKFLCLPSELQPFYFDIAFTGDEGPFYTRDHQFRLEAIPLTEGTTFIHFRYSYSYSSLGYYVMKIFSRGEVGFSITGTGSDGNPVYVGGVRGSVERNVVRFYLAVQSYLDTLKSSPEQRFEKQINQWYDLAAPYKKQLLEMKKDEYLSYKRQDRRSQQKLQSEFHNY